MKVETLLPLGKLDPGLRESDTPLDIRTVFRDAQEVEALAYDGMVVEETKDDPYVVLGLAAQATQRITLSTSIALAFPRSPTVTAMSAWTLQTGLAAGCLDGQRAWESIERAIMVRSKRSWLCSTTKKGGEHHGGNRTL